jgi:hypothetical protein
MRVLADDDGGLLLWQPVGADFATIVDADGNTGHDLSPDRMREPRLRARAWQGADIVMLMQPEARHSVWWFFEDGVFAGWYVNLEEPYTRWPGGVQTTDHVLDIVATPERRWEWKDLGEFERHTGHPLYYDEAGAAAIRAEGERLTGLIDAGVFPFDGTHTDFRPGSAWPVPRFPQRTGA